MEASLSDLLSRQQYGAWIGIYLHSLLFWAQSFLPFSAGRCHRLGAKKESNRLVSENKIAVLKRFRVAVRLWWRWIKGQPSASSAKTMISQARHQSYCATPSVTMFFALIVAWFTLLATFYTHPTIDISVSSAFFRGPLCAGALSGVECGYFPLRRMEVFKGIRWMLYLLPYVAAMLIVVMGLIGAFSRQLREHLPMTRLLVALISLGVGPGLLVNSFLKTFSGRPRPFQTNLFGGNLDFTAAGTFVGECTRNCSFVSGEASGAGWLLCLLFLVPANARVWIAPPLIIASTTMAALRVAVGSHYASDALLGWLLAVIVFMGMLILESKILAGWDRSSKKASERSLRGRWRRTSVDGSQTARSEGSCKPQEVGGLFQTRSLRGGGDITSGG